MNILKGALTHLLSAKERLVVQLRTAGGRNPFLAAVKQTPWTRMLDAAMNGRDHEIDAMLQNMFSSHPLKIPGWRVLYGHEKADQTSKDLVLEAKESAMEWVKLLAEGKDRAGSLHGLASCVRVTRAMDRLLQKQESDLQQRPMGLGCRAAQSIIAPALSLLVKKGFSSVPGEPSILTVTEDLADLVIHAPHCAGVSIFSGDSKYDRESVFAWVSTKLAPNFRLTEEVSTLKIRDMLRAFLSSLDQSELERPAQDDSSSFIPLYPANASNAAANDSILNTLERFCKAGGTPLWIEAATSMLMDRSSLMSLLISLPPDEQINTIDRMHEFFSNKVSQRIHELGLQDFKIFEPRTQELIKESMRHFFSPTERTPSAYTIAIIYGRPGLARKLHEHNCDEPALYVAIQSRNIELLGIALQSCSEEINGSLEHKKLEQLHGCTPLHFASLLGEHAMVSMLLDKGADFEAINHFEQSPRLLVETCLSMMESGDCLSDEEDHPFDAAMKQLIREAHVGLLKNPFGDELSAELMARMQQTLALLRTHENRQLIRRITQTGLSA